MLGPQEPKYVPSRKTDPETSYYERTYPRAKVVRVEYLGYTMFVGVGTQPVEKQIENFIKFISMIKK